MYFIWAAANTSPFNQFQNYYFMFVPHSPSTIAEDFNLKSRDSKLIAQHDWQFLISIPFYCVKNRQDSSCVHLEMIASRNYLHMAYSSLLYWQCMPVGSFIRGWYVDTAHHLFSVQQVWICLTKLCPFWVPRLDSPTTTVSPGTGNV